MHLDLPAVLLGEARVHAENLGGEERSLVAASAGADFEDDVLLVVGILGEEQDLQFFFESLPARLERGDFFLGHGAQVCIVAGKELAGIIEALADLLEFAEPFYGRFDFAKLLGDFLIALVVVEDLGQSELGLEVAVALLHLFETVKHWALPGRPPRGGGVLDVLRMENTQEGLRRREPLRSAGTGWWRITARTILARNAKEEGYEAGTVRSMWLIRIRVLCWVTVLEHNPEPAECKVAGVGAEQENRPSPEIQMSIGDKRDEADDYKP